MNPPVPRPRTGAPAAVRADPEFRNVALLIDGREYVFSVGTADISAAVELLEGWADTCRLAAATLRRCHARLQAEQRAQAEIASAGGPMRACALCDSPNAAPRTACHWCGNPLGRVS
ncbi:hypothetical protein F4561_004436 [Lipingzhangella halophila]|uniref:Uncharacterized protein n=1 Tax=Lipingzhangella halophila TaxID=1783352 RepID=A0A7W7W4B5_9ACTN|nr:hypothetical protein [Lipingzhangella halophila]MBB4933616.1 hypothetical protein [Lipingzhangella halophila]